MKNTSRLLLLAAGFTFMSLASFAAQESKKPAYNPKESQDSVSESTEGATILIFKVTPGDNESGNVKKAGRAERTTAAPNISRLKADQKRTVAGLT